MQERTLGELAEYVDGHVYGDPNVIIKSAATPGRANEGDISFLTNRKYAKQLQRHRDILTKWMKDTDDQGQQRDNPTGKTIALSVELILPS